MADGHYNLNKLHKIFAITTLVLLASLIAMFGKDYAREWKKHQKKYQELEVEFTRVKYDGALKELAKNSEYAQTKVAYQKAKKALQSQESNIQKLKSQIESVQAEKDLFTQQLQFARAEYDVVRYNYAAIVEGYHGASGDATALKEKLEGIAKKIEALTFQEQTKSTELKKLGTAIDVVYKEKRTLKKKKNRLAQKENLLKKKLEKIDPQERSIANTIASIIRDLPILELANPTLKVKQIVLKDITDDVVLMRVPKVDRCITCHVGIDNPDFKDAAQPLRTHPNLEQYVGKDSAHPMESFGCTVCHDGRGRATSFVDAAHMPLNAEQAKEWKEKHGWSQLKHWARPMYPKNLIQAGCFQCHSNETQLKGASELNLGLNLIEKAGCYGCHNIERYEDWPKPGPSLHHLTSKMSKEWAFKWIKDPKSFRHNTWMPSYFGQSNNSDSIDIRRSNQEIHAMVHYLFNQSDDFTLSKVPYEGNVENGKELINSVGCLACHKTSGEKRLSAATQKDLQQEHGPALTALASKATKEWIYNWIKNPQAYHPNTKMPDLRLTNQEASDITAYLFKDRNTQFDSMAVPAINESTLEGIVFDFISRNKPISIAKKEAKAMSREDKLNYAGERLIRHYGCFACHDIKGFENDKPIGVDLTHIGNKDIHRLDFGFLHIDHTKHAWFHQKLKNPRAFDKGKILGSYERLVMPNFYLKNAEASAIVTALMGFVKDRPKSNMMPPKSTANVAKWEGQSLVRQMNCQSCHIVEGEGGNISESIMQWLIEYEKRGKTEAETVTEAFSPPNLLGVGAKLQSKWFYGFLNAPNIVRPWLKVRMPRYHMNTSKLNKLVKYFHSLDEVEAFETIHDTKLTKKEYIAAEKLFSEDYFACTQCHVVGEKLPTGLQESWAPNLALAKNRLRPDWMLKWITNPPAVMPGTKMPTFYDPSSYSESGPEDLLDGDEDHQIRVLRDYLMTLSDDKPQAKAAVTKEVSVSAASKTDIE